MTSDKAFNYFVKLGLKTCRRKCVPQARIAIKETLSTGHAVTSSYETLPPI